MKKENLYTAPQVEVLRLETEMLILTPSTWSNGSIGDDNDDYYDLGNY